VRRFALVGLAQALLRALDGQAFLVEQALDLAHGGYVGFRVGALSGGGAHGHQNVFELAFPKAQHKGLHVQQLGRLPDLICACLCACVHS